MSRDQIKLIKNANSTLISMHFTVLHIVCSLRVRYTHPAINNTQVK